MSRVIDLIPGNRVGGCTFIAQSRHPFWPSMQLVIWQLGDGTWSYDVLSPQQDVGVIEPDSVNSLKRNLAAVFKPVHGQATP